MAVYGCVVASTANVLAATQGGSAMVALASGAARSGPAPEMIITLRLRSAAMALVAATVVTQWGQRKDTVE